MMTNNIIKFIRWIKSLFISKTKESELTFSPPLEVRSELLFEKYLKEDKSKRVYSHVCFSTVFERINDDVIREVHLAVYMSIVIHYRTLEERAINKNKAFIILASSFDELVRQGLISYGCMASSSHESNLFHKTPCMSLDLVPIDKDGIRLHGSSRALDKETLIYREYIGIWPFGTKKLREIGIEINRYLNDILGIELFSYEGELPRIFIDIDGSIKSSSSLQVTPLYNDKIVEALKKSYL